MFTNGLNMGLLLWAWVKKTVQGMEPHWYSNKEKVSDAAVSKEGHADSLLRYIRIHYKWKKSNYKQCFLYLTPKAKFTFFIEWVCIFVTDKPYIE